MPQGKALGFGRELLVVQYPELWHLKRTIYCPGGKAGQEMVSYKVFLKWLIKNLF
jgi:hypothetical protein